MLPRGNYRGSKYNSQLTFATPVLVNSTLIIHLVSISPISPVSTRKQKQKDTLEVREPKADGVNMEPEAFKEQTRDTAERSGSDDNDDENTSGSDTIIDGPFRHSQMAGSKVSREQGVHESSLPIRQSIEPGEKEICVTATDDGANNTIANNTIANNTTWHNTFAQTIADADTMSRRDDSNSMLFSDYEEFSALFAPAEPDKDPAGVPYGKSMTVNPGDLEIELTKTPTETSTETSTTTETSTITETSTTMNDPAVRSSSPQNVEIEPFNYPGCPPKVRQQILRHLLRSDEAITPWYNFGALQVPADDSSDENFTALPQSFAGNPELLDEATTILYGENSFSLHRTAVSLWWLRRIGPNISKLRHLIIYLEEGIIDRFGTRAETLWLSIVDLLSQKHQLRTIAVSFAAWTSKIYPEDGLDPVMDVYVSEPRNAIMTTLLKFRGLEEAAVAPGGTLSDYLKDVLEEAMLLDKGVTNEDILRLEYGLRGPTREKYSFA